MRSKPTAKGFPCEPADCHESRHLEGPDYKIWDVMCAAAPRKNGERTFYASVEPWLCNAANQSPSAVTATLARLERTGWIIKLNKEPRRGADGKSLSNIYRVLEHEEFVALHPGSCPDYKLAPDDATAVQYGVEKGDRIPTGRTPWNFLKDKPAPPSVTRDAIVAWMESLTDAEKQEVVSHWKELAALNEVNSGQPKPAEPPPVDSSQLRSTGAGTASGRPDSPPPVDGDSRLRLTGENPRATREKKSDNTNTTEESAKQHMADRDEVDELWCVLLRKFVDHDGDPPKRTTPNEIREVKKNAARVGREIFLAAVDAWLKDHPWDAQTTNPLIGFNSGFEAYVAKVAYNSKVKNRRMTQEQKDRTTRIAKIQHVFYWLTATFNEEEKAYLKALTDRNVATWTDNEIDRALVVLRDAERRQEERKETASSDDEASDEFFKNA
jgi:hypothetical protein